MAEIIMPDIEVIYKFYKPVRGFLWHLLLPRSVRGSVFMATFKRSTYEFTAYPEFISDLIPVRSGNRVSG